ncbi:hypothetical protein PtrV1_11366 [Pyrenophora tritici-repentis]|nr:hypothetical protein PtrV1_11366 [Pyrenophora tritici-repentis]KAI0569538.1 hypothetical protein Alg215_11579 [Pyrenophora tritici-repentis]
MFSFKTVAVLLALTVSMTSALPQNTAEQQCGDCSRFGPCGTGAAPRCVWAAGSWYCSCGGG